MPNFASRNQSGTVYACSDSRVPVNLPFAISSRGAARNCDAGSAAAKAPNAPRRVMFISVPR